MQCFCGQCKQFDDLNCYFPDMKVKSKAVMEASLQYKAQIFNVLPKIQYIEIIHNMIAVEKSIKIMPSKCKQI